MSTITPIAPAARTILFALDHLKTADEAKIREYLSGRDRTGDAAQAMQKLIDDEMVERIEPAAMSAQLPKYKLTPAGSHACMQARDEEAEWLTDQLANTPLRKGLSACQEIILRTIRAGAGDATKIKNAVKAVGFTETEISNAFRPMEQAGLVEEHSWGMMSETPPSEYIRKLGLVQLDVMGLPTPMR